MGALGRRARAAAAVGGRHVPGRVARRAAAPFPAACSIRPARQLSDAQGHAVAVSGRGEQSAPPARVECAELPGRRRRVRGWAGPWGSDVRWWDPPARRRCARWQVVVDCGADGGDVACVGRSSKPAGPVSRPSTTDATNVPDHVNESKRSSRRRAGGVFGVLALTAIPFYLVLGRKEWFFLDESETSSPPAPRGNLGDLLASARSTTGRRCRSWRARAVDGVRPAVVSAVRLPAARGTSAVAALLRAVMRRAGVGAMISRPRSPACCRARCAYAS